MNSTNRSAIALPSRLFHDFFTEESDIDLTNHVSDSGQNWLNLVQSFGSISVISASNDARAVTPTGTSRLYKLDLSSLTERPATIRSFVMNTNTAKGSKDVGVALRLQDPQNYVEVILTRVGTGTDYSLTINEYVSGVLGATDTASVTGSADFAANKVLLVVTDDGTTISADASSVGAALTASITVNANLTSKNVGLASNVLAINAVWDTLEGYASA